jgi:hypothetical protein
VLELSRTGFVAVAALVPLMQAYFWIEQAGVRAPLMPRCNALSLACTCMTLALAPRFVALAQELVGAKAGQHVRH